MPRAGNNSANRAKAHLQWADRYNRYGDTQKAAAHFGRALEYDRHSARGQEFGGFEVDGYEIGVHPDLVKNVVMATGAVAAPLVAEAASRAVVAAGPYVTAATDAVTKAATNARNYIWPEKKSDPSDRRYGKTDEPAERWYGKTDEPAERRYGKTDEPADEPNKKNDAPVMQARGALAGARAPSYREMTEKYRQWTLRLGDERIQPFFNEVDMPVEENAEDRYNYWIGRGALIAWTRPKNE